MKNTVNKEFLDSFFKMMDLIILSFGQINESVFGIVTGIGTDIHEFWQHQNFYWHIDKNEQELSDLIVLCDFLNEKKLINGDKILVSEEALLSRISVLGWDNDKCKKVTDDLFSIEVKMIDDGEETDSFFIHL